MRIVSLLLLAVCSFAQPRWQIERSRLATILFGISYVDANNGFVQGAQDGQGPLILNSRNGGQTYQQLADTGSNFLFLAGAAHSATSATSGGLGLLTSGIQYTNNGASYTDATLPAVPLPPVVQTQSAAVVKGRQGQRDGAFGYVGQFFSTTGVAFTANGGVSWSLHEIPNAPAQPRYGAFPTMSTWYVSGGDWPERKAFKGDGFQLSERITANYQNASQKASVLFTEPSAKDGDKSAAYVAYVSKTTDGGRTWQQVFFNTQDQFYFNGIDCADANNCAVVAEGLTGAFLFVTNDGGATWNRRLTIPGRAASLFDVKFVNSREAWACGGIIDFAFTGQFFRSLDGGNTWQANPFPGVYGTSLTFATVGQGYEGHATALTIDGQSSTLVYR